MAQMCERTGPLPLVQDLVEFEVIDTVLFREIHLH